MALGTILDRIGTAALIRRILAVILSASLVLGASGIYIVLRDRAIEAASREASLLLSAAAAVSAFTDGDVSPLIDKLPTNRFYKQAVPFFAVNSVFDRLRDKYPNYTLRQPALNPTNPHDRPTPHEVELTLRFRNEPTLTELQGVRQDGDRTLFYVATPIRVGQEQCLVCHSTPDRAPPAMVAAYGSSDGFGWTLGDTVGIMELSVPITDELRGTTELTAVIATCLLIVFLVTYLALTTTLGRALVSPLRRLAQAAEAASRSADEPLDLPSGGTTEVRRLSEAIGRLDISLRKSLRRLSGGPPPPPAAG